VTTGKVADLFATVLHFGARHDVYCAPATKLLETIADYGTAGLVIVDPPSLVGIGRQPDDWTTHHEQEAALAPVASGVSRVLRPGGSCICIGEPALVSAWDAACALHGLRFAGDMVVLWDETTESAQQVYERTLSERRRLALLQPSVAASLFMQVHWHVKPGYRLYNQRQQVQWDSNVLVAHRTPNVDRYCPTQRPVELFNHLISNLLSPGDLVVDPFCGSGSALVAASMCDMEWRGGDIDASMCQVARKRLGMVDTVETWNLRKLRKYKAGRLVELWE
jgi:DNA modification methylase